MTKIGFLASLILTTVLVAAATFRSFEQPTPLKTISRTILTAVIPPHSPISMAMALPISPWQTARDPARSASTMEKPISSAARSALNPPPRFLPQI
jgi:hypothetical protein